MDRTSANRMMSDNLSLFSRPDRQYNVTSDARQLIDSNHDGQVDREEVLEGLMRDQISFDPKLREIIANRSRMPIDPAIMPRDQSATFGTVEQCMEFAMRYFKESRAKAGMTSASFNVDFGRQHDIADEVRLMANGKLDRPGYDAYLNGGITPPRAGDILSAESPRGHEFHVAVVTDVEPKGDRWEVSVFQANIPFNVNSHDLQDHIQTLPLDYQNGRWTMPPIPTRAYRYGEDMNVVGWIHPEGDKALPGAAA